MRFVSIMVTTPIFGVSRFMFKIGDAQRAKWTFLNGPKMSKNRGSKLDIFYWIIRFSNEIFSPVLPLKHKLPSIRIHEVLHFMDFYNFEAN
jgi:hypothetical protein